MKVFSEIINSQDEASVEPDPVALVAQFIMNEASVEPDPVALVTQFIMDEAYAKYLQSCESTSAAERSSEPDVGERYSSEPDLIGERSSEPNTDPLNDNCHSERSTNSANIFSARFSSENSSDSSSDDYSFFKDKFSSNENVHLEDGDTDDVHHNDVRPEDRSDSDSDLDHIFPDDDVHHNDIRPEDHSDSDIDHIFPDDDGHHNDIGPEDHSDSDIDHIFPDDVHHNGIRPEDHSDSDIDHIFPDDDVHHNDVHPDHSDSIINHFPDDDVSSSSLGSFYADSAVNISSNILTSSDYAESDNFPTGREPSDDEMPVPIRFNDVGIAIDNRLSIINPDDDGDDDDSNFDFYVDLDNGHNGLHSNSSFNGSNNFPIIGGLTDIQIDRIPTRIFSIDKPPHASNITLKKRRLNKECCICFSDYSSGDCLRTLPCFHEFHKFCLDPWLKRETSCPVCRVSVHVRR